MPTIEELEQELSDTKAARDLLSAELSNQAAQFAEWRRGVSQIVTLSFGDGFPITSLSQFDKVVSDVCGL